MPPAVKTLVLAADVGGTRIRTALVDRTGAVRHRRQAPTPRTGLAAELVSCLRSTLAAYDGPAPSALGIAAPGPLSLSGEAIETSANLGGTSTELAAPLRAAFGLPVTVQRDTVVAAYGERAYGAARGHADFAYVTVSTGIGAAVISGGRLFTGAHGLAGEIGHAVVDLDGPPCGCGQRGCLESLASGTGIARATGTDAREVIAAASAGDPAAGRIVDRAVRAFAAAMAGFVNAFDPGLVVVGGGVALGLGEALLAPARAEVARHAYGSAARRTTFVAASLGDDAGLAGAVPLIGDR